mmetsp:Transcript_27512/g.46049  ORF Transcript_27512/g.46049 Transcript_27512/m.46049 type:complete len:200 (-) Transcript_27512:563-1162(-)
MLASRTMPPVVLAEPEPTCPSHRIRGGVLSPNSRLTRLESQPTHPSHRPSHWTRGCGGLTIFQLAVTRDSWQVLANLRRFPRPADTFYRGFIVTTFFRRSFGFEGVNCVCTGSRGRFCRRAKRRPRRHIGCCERKLNLQLICVICLMIRVIRVTAAAFVLPLSTGHLRRLVNRCRGQMRRTISFTSGSSTTRLGDYRCR